MTAAVDMIASLIHAFAPDLPPERIREIATIELLQQDALGTVLTDAVDAEKRKHHPRFGFRVIDMRSGESIAEVNAPKDLAKAGTLNELKHGIDVIAFATSPAARAVLHSFGYAIEFFQKKESLIAAPH
jgi:hypothetical protein